MTDAPTSRSTHGTGRCRGPRIWSRSFCNVNFGPGCIRRALGQTIAPPNAENPYSYQASIGVQRQIGDTMGVTADYSYNGQRKDRVQNYNINLSFNPGDRAELPVHRHQPAAVSGVGPVPMDIFEGWGNYHGMRDVVHEAAEQPLAGLGHLQPLVVPRRRSPTLERRDEPGPVPAAGPLGESYGLAITDQRHRAVFNGIWQMGYGFQLSGLYFFGSGQRFGTRYGGDALNTGGIGNANDPALGNPSISARARPASAGWRRDAAKRHRRRSDSPRRCAAPEAVRAARALEHRRAVRGLQPVQPRQLRVLHWAESSPQYGQPSFNPNVAYQPRMLQMGFRFAF